MRFVIPTILASTLYATCANAGVLDFTCGTIEFTVDFDRSTVSDTIDGTASVDWQYDGDWVRWNVKDTDEFYGVNTKTGALILDGVVNDAGCRMGDTTVLATLPLSEGAYLRRAFIDLPEQKRMEIQSILSQNGYYSSDIDGKWGRGTEAAIKTYVSENQEEMPAADYTSPEGAANTLFGAMSHMNIDAECLDCTIEDKTGATASTVDSEVEDPSISQQTLQDIADSFLQCWNVGAMSSSALSDGNSVKVRFKTTQSNFQNYIDPETIALVWTNASENDARQIFETLRRALKLCGSQVDYPEFYGADYRTYELTQQIQPEWENGRSGLTLRALAMQSDIDRAERERIAELERERKAAAAKRAAVQAEENRKREAEAAARLKAAEEAAKERAAATSEKIEELRRKCASSVTVSGLCWALNHDEMRLVLIGRGFTCGDGSGGGFTNMAVGLASLFYGMAGEKMSMCEKSDAWVMIEPENLTFSCDVFNTCSYNVRDLGRLLIDEGFARSLEPSVQVIEGVALTSYCGRGNDGTEICAINRYDMVGQERNVVSLRKGTAGGEAPSFD